MFKGCIKLGKINISSFNTENVRNMLEMFKGCKKLSEINLPFSFNTKYF